MAEMGVQDEHVERLCEQVRQRQNGAARANAAVKQSDADAVRCLESKREAAADTACS